MDPLDPLDPLGATGPLDPSNPSGTSDPSDPSDPPGGASGAWSPALPPDALGAVASGPVLLSRAAGVGAGLRCVLAHPEGLHLQLVLRARGVHAEAAQRQDSQLAPPTSELHLAVRAGGRAGSLEPFDESTTSSEDEYDLEADYWLPLVPGDGVLEVTVGWPEVGLPEATTVVPLDLADLAGRTVDLV